MDAPETMARSGLKARLLTLLQAGAGSLVLATTVLTAPAPAAPAATDALLQRADAARARLVQSLPASEQATDKPAELAWWGNRWGNGGWHPWWHNWPNGWHNWHNWGNW